MKARKRFSVLFAVALILSAGCVTLYDASVPGELNRILVVEGFINLSFG
jgi:hypothetical protein